MSISLAKNPTLFSSKQVLTRIEAIKYLHKHMGYTLNSANFTLQHWTSIRAIPSQLKEGRRYYAIGDILKFSDPEERKRLVRVAKERRDYLYTEALKPVPSTEEDTMLRQMKNYTEQPELPFESASPVKRLNRLPMAERKRVFTETYMTPDEIYAKYFTSGRELAELVRTKKLDRIKIRTKNERSTGYAYPRDQVDRLLTSREDEILILI